MSPLTGKFSDKLEKAARAIAAEKPILHFVGLAQRADVPPDRWDLLASSDQLEPWSIDSIRYIVEKLRQNGFKPADMVRIARIAVLPTDNKLIRRLIESDEPFAEPIPGLHPMDYPDRAYVVWPMRATPAVMVAADSTKIS